VKNNNLLKFIAVIAVIIIAGALFSGPLLTNQKLGLDLSGGVSVLLEAKGTPEAPVTEEAMQQLKEIMSRRVNELGVSEPNIQLVGDNRLLLELAAVEDPQEAIATLKQTAMLEFRSPEGEVLLTGAYLKDARAYLDERYNEPKVSLEFTPEGAEIFAEITTQYVGQVISIYLDNQPISEPVVRQPILDGKAEISGGFTSFEEAANLAALLRGGALPVSVEIVEQHIVGPQLGQDSLNRSITAIAIGLIGIALYLILNYLLAGVIADLSLIVYALIVLTILWGINAVLTLPGIAGLLLGVGMAVDANILIYERFKDEMRLGKSLRAGVDAGFKNALSTIIDSNTTTLITAAVLFFYGIGAIKGFALNLGVSILVSLFTAVVFTRFLLRLAVRCEPLKKNWLYGLREKSRKFNFDFIKQSRVFLIISVVIFAASLLSLGFQGLNYGIDFTGGNIFHIQLAEEVNNQEVREFLDSQGLEAYTLTNLENNQLMIRTTPLSEEDTQKFTAGLTKTFSGAEILANDQVSPAVGKELTNRAIIGVLIAMVLMLIYITFRFQFYFGLSAIIALIHDTIIVLGIFSLLQLEVDGTFVAAMLTLIGYSINDTIVVFDRIRENLKKSKKEDAAAIVNKSINETLIRSLNTSITVIIVLLSLLLLGGVTTRLFSLALLLGVIIGTYSSIFIASPLWVRFVEKRQTRGVKAKA